MKQRASAGRIVLFSTGGGYVELRDRSGPGPADLLDKLRGAEMVVYAPGRFSGAFAGASWKEDPAAGAGRPVLELATAAGPQAVAFSAIQSISLSGEPERGQCQAALDDLIVSQCRQGAAAELRFVDRLGRPETVPAGGPHAAIVPLLRAPLRFEDVTYYDFRSPNTPPARAAYLTNQLAGELPACSADIFHAGEPAGQVKTSPLPRGGRTVAPYGPDERLAVETSPFSGEAVLGGRIAHGLQLKNLVTSGTQFVLTNRTGENLPVIVDYPRSPGWRLIEPPEYEEQTETIWRIRFHVYKNARRTVQIVQERVTPG